MKFNCGEQEYEFICDLNIIKQICDKSISELFANYSQIENYSLNTRTYYNLIGPIWTNLVPLGAN